MLISFAVVQLTQIPTDTNLELGSCMAGFVYGFWDHLGLLQLVLITSAIVSLGLIIFGLVRLAKPKKIIISPTVTKPRKNIILSIGIIIFLVTMAAVYYCTINLEQKESPSGIWCASRHTCISEGEICP
jgi:hypothetical protein